MDTCIAVGVPRDTVTEARKAINDILHADVADATRNQALQTLGQLCTVANTNIHDCHFVVNPSKKKTVS